MESVAAVMLLLCSVGFVCSVDSGKDSTFSLILRELLTLQAELNKQRLEIGKLRSDAETQKSNLENEIGKLVAELNKQQDLQASTKRLSSSYVRWGRTRCDGDATVVHKGYAAGPRYHSESGSGSNFLCLHENPQWKRYRSGSQWTGDIYGVQYEIWEGSNNVFSLSNNGGQDLGPHPGPCVMCNVPNRSTVVTIAARTECPAGWYKEYGGYVISSYRGYMQSSYICWDDAPETAPGGNNIDQSVIYPTEVQCGTLPCSTYISGRELTCVVCSK